MLKDFWKPSFCSSPFVFMPQPLRKFCPKTFCPSKASWLENLPLDDLKEYTDPTGKVETQKFFIKYNVSVALSKFVPKK